MFCYTVYTTTIPLQQFVFYLVNLPAAHTFPLHYWNGLALTTCAPVCEASIVIRDSNIDDIFQTTYQLVLFNLQAASSSLSTEPLSIVDELPTVPKGLYWYGSNPSSSAFVSSPSSLLSSTSSLFSSLEQSCVSSELLKSRSSYDKSLQESLARLFCTGASSPFPL